MQRVLNILLILVIAAGAVTLVMRQRNLTTMAAEYATLTERFGKLEVTDPDRYLFGSRPNRRPAAFSVASLHTSQYKI